MSTVNTKKNSSIRILERKSNEGDIAAAFQLADYYTQGKYVDKNNGLAKKYYDIAFEKFQHQNLQILSVKLVNFRAFEDSELILCTQNNLTVIVGNNGAGKTTFLDSMTMSISWLIKRITGLGSGGEFIEEMDIKNDCTVDYGEVITGIKVNSFLNCEVVLSTGKIGSNVSKRNQLKNIRQLADIYKYSSSRDSNFNLPIFAYYSVERALEISSKDIKEYYKFSEQAKWDKFEGYDKATNGKADFRLFFRWFKFQEDIANSDSKVNQKLISEIEKIEAELSSELLKTIEKRAQNEGGVDDFLISFKKDKLSKIEELKSKLESKEEPNNILDVVKEAIYQFMPSFSNIRIQRTPDLDMLIDKDNKSLSVLQLSQGEKSLLALVADIARRLAMLNSSLTNPLQGHGVVMIDEIDLHLHPNWQQKVIPNILKAFPNIQFIVTTHSPQVLSTVPSESIRMLNNGKIFSAPKGSKGAESSRLLKRIFDVPPRPEQDENSIMLKEYEKLVYLDDWDSEKARKMRSNLNNIFSNEEPKLTELDLYIENRTWELDN